MSWLLAAVMSVCEEDPRRCRSLRRRRLQRLRGGGGGGGGDDGGLELGDADLRELSTALDDDDNDDDNVVVRLERSADDQPHGSETEPPSPSSARTDNCRTGNC